MNIPDTHKTEEIVLDGEEEVKFDCDTLIAPLIRKLNAAGFYTEYCCSGHEENAFYTMYIYFKPMDNNDMEDKLDNMIKQTDGYFIPEIKYTIRSVGFVAHKVTLYDPSIEDLDLAVKLCFHVNFDDVFYVNSDCQVRSNGRFMKNIRKCITIRPNIPEDKVDVNHIQENYEFVMAGIDLLMRLVDDIET